MTEERKEVGTQEAEVKEFGWDVAVSTVRQMHGIILDFKDHMDVIELLEYIIPSRELQEAIEVPADYKGLNPRNALQAMLCRVADGYREMAKEFEKLIRPFEKIRQLDNEEISKIQNQTGRFREGLAECCMLGINPTRILWDKIYEVRGPRKRFEVEDGETEKEVVS